MKKIFLLLIVALILVMPVLANTNMELQVEIRLANLDRLAKGLEVSMDSMVSYITQINGDVSKLSSYKSEFVNKKEDLKNARTNSELDEKIRAASAEVSKFWEEYKIQFNANKGNMLVSTKGVLDSLKAAKPEIDGLTEKYWATRKDNVLQIYDNDVALVQKVADSLPNHRCSSQISSKLDEIKTSRSLLESALSSRNEAQIINTQSSIILLAQQFGDYVAGKC